MRLLNSIMKAIYGDSNVVMMNAEIDILKANMIVKCRQCRQLYIISRNPVLSLSDHKEHKCNE